MTTNETDTVNVIEYDEDREPMRVGASPVPRDEQPGLTVDNAFLGSLNMRMKDAEWDKYERGSEAFFGIDHDLEQLAKVDPDAARQLWKENAPPGSRLPYYLDKEQQPAQAAEATKGRAPEAGADREAGQAPEDRPAVKKTPAELAKEEAYEVPDSIKKKYLAANNRYFFREDKNKLAFEDRGRKMLTEHNDPDVAASLVELAKAKGWTKIKVAGHEDFKREAWLHATLEGIEVSGYKPKDVDLAKLKEMQAGRLKNVVERDEGREPTEPSRAVGKAKEAALTPAASANRDQETPGVLTGKLVDHGRAPYDFNKNNEPNYYVKLDTGNGMKMYWGIDLERAMSEAQVKPGERIELERLGKQPVVVKEKQFDDKGHFVGVKDVDSERVQWRVDREGQRREPEKAPAPPLQGDYKVAAAVLADVLKEKGYSLKNVDKAMAEATKRLDSMRENGQPAPAVKMFDRAAQRERPREKIVIKSKQKEQERTR